MNDSPKKLEIVIPLFNEQEVLLQLIARLVKAFSPSQLAKHHLSDVTILFIDDGSKDNSPKIINDAIENGFPARLIRLSRNFGHQSAVTAGITLSTEELVAIMDADLQDPPEVILQMIDKSREGYDVVYGQRRKRKENFFKVFCYWLFYRVLSFLSEVEIGMDSGDFCLMDRKVVEALSMLPERLRFPRGLRSWVGFRQVGLEYERDTRYAGSSKYSFKKLYELATDGIASSSTRPLQLVQLFAFFFGFVLFVSIGICFFEYFARSPKDRVQLWFLIGYTLTSLGGFLLLLSLHIICAYISRMYLEVKGRPAFIVMQIVGKKSDISLSREATYEYQVLGKRSRTNLSSLS